MTKREVDEHLSTVCDGCGLEMMTRGRLTKKALAEGGYDLCPRCMDDPHHAEIKERIARQDHEA